MFSNVLKAIFGSRNYRLLKQYRKSVDIINALEPAIEKLSDEALAAKTPEFRARVAGGTPLEEVLPEAFAVVREASTTGGTTVVEMVRILPAGLQATFFTGSIPAAYEYAQHPNIQVIFMGDRISKSSQIAVGGEAISIITSIKADLCFLGINAIDGAGVSENDWEVVQVKQSMIKASKKTVVLSITEKINTRQRFAVCGLDEIDTIITDSGPGNPLFEGFVAAGVKLL